MGYGAYRTFVTEGTLIPGEAANPRKQHHPSRLVRKRVGKCQAISIGSLRRRSAKQLSAFLSAPEGVGDGTPLQREAPVRPYVLRSNYLSRFFAIVCSCMLLVPS